MSRPDASAVDVDDDRCIDTGSGTLNTSGPVDGPGLTTTVVDVDRLGPGILDRLSLCPGQSSGSTAFSLFRADGILLVLVSSLN